MKLTELLESYTELLRQEREDAARRGLDAPIGIVGGKRLTSCGMLHLYDLELTPEGTLLEDVAVTVLPGGHAEPTEGFVVDAQPGRALVQTFDAFGQTVSPATLVPDTSGFFETVARRLDEMVHKADAYTLGPADRLLPWLDPERLAGRPASSEGVLTTIWNPEPAQRGARLAAAVVEAVRSNKRILLVGPDHRATDELLGLLARALRAAGLQYKSLLSRYEMPLQMEVGGQPVSDLGFEAQVHLFYAKSRADKAALRRKYERFRELTPLLAYKAEKQRDLDEVKLLEWRLLTQLSELQAKIREIDATVAQYEQIPVWKRLAMQTVGKNTDSLGQYRTIYEGMIKELMGQLEEAQRRIEELKPEAAIPKDLRPEYNELKEDIKRLGGTKKIREMLAAEEGTNRQAFIQNKRVVVTTAARVAVDPLFTKVRFDVLMAAEAPRIPAPLLLAAAGLVRERLVLTGDVRELPGAEPWRGSSSFTGSGIQRDRHSQVLPSPAP